MSNMQLSYEVAIVGAGPCGVSAANLLGKYGIKTLIIDSEPGIVMIPRAIGICEEGSRIMQAAGVMREVSQGTRTIKKVIFADRDQQTVLHTDIDPCRNGYPVLSTFYQPDLEASLRRGLERYPEVDLLCSTELLDFSDRGDKVTLTLLQGGQQHEVSCRYLLACDGAKSGIRKQLGIGFSGNTYPQDWMILDIENNPVPDHQVVFTIDPERPSVTMSGPGDKRRWEFVIKPGEDPETLFSRDRLRELLQPWGDVDEMSIQRKAVYTFHARTAERFRSGNVFLLGDAAHITPPFAGQGMMAGLRDVHNLCWKLAAVLQGRVDERVLESYERERIPQARQIIAVAQRMGHIILPQKKLTARLRDGVIKLAGLLGLHSETRGAPIQKISNHINGGLLRHLFISLFRRVGSEFPQYRLGAADGDQALFDDLVGNGFLLLSWQGSAWDHLGADTRARWESLGGACVTFIPGGVAGPDCGSLIDADNCYRETFKAGERCIVIRPDKMVVINCKAGALDKKLNRYMDRLGMDRHIAPGSNAQSDYELKQA